MNQPENNNRITEPVDFLRQGCERPWEVAVEPFKVAPQTWYVGNSWVGAYLIDSGDGLILIDATMQPQIYLVLESIRKLGLNPADIKKILLSHAHYDHCGGIRAMLEVSGAQLYMSHEDEAFINEHPEMYFTEGYPFGSFKPDLYYSDDVPIKLGNVVINTLLTPGHTPGTTSFFFDVADADGKIYHCGMHGGVGVNTLTDDFISEHGLSVGTREDFLNSLLRVRDYDIDITLGSHPGQVDMLEKAESITANYNPFVDKSVWPDLIDKRMAMIREIMGN